MKKATIPISYIVAIILGIIVVAVLAYWFFMAGGRGGEVVSASECRARIVSFCLEVGVTGKKSLDEAASKVCGCSGTPSREDIFCNNFTTNKAKTGCVI